MNSRISETDAAARPARGNLLRRFARDGEGTAIVEFALILPALVIMIIVLFELLLMGLTYHQATEAARRGARMAIIARPIVEVNDIADGQKVSCKVTSEGGAVNCTTGSTMVAPATFDTILGEMKAIMPNIKETNLIVEYSPSGHGDIETPGGKIPLVTVRIVDFQHKFLMTKAANISTTGFTLPPLEVSLTGAGKPSAGY